MMKFIQTLSKETICDYKDNPMTDVIKHLRKLVEK